VFSISFSLSNCPIMERKPTWLSPGTRNSGRRADTPRPHRTNPPYGCLKDIMLFFVDSREKAHYLVHPPIVTVTMRVTVVVTIAGFPDMCNAESGEYSNYGSGRGGGDTAFGRFSTIGYFQASSTTSMAFTIA